MFRVTEKPWSSPKAERIRHEGSNRTTPGSTLAYGRWQRLAHRWRGFPPTCLRRYTNLLSRQTFSTVHRYNPLYDFSPCQPPAAKKETWRTAVAENRPITKYGASAVSRQRPQLGERWAGLTSPPWRIDTSHDRIYQPNRRRPVAWLSSTSTLHHQHLLPGRRGLRVGSPNFFATLTAFNARIVSPPHCSATMCFSCWFFISSFYFAAVRLALA